MPDRPKRPNLLFVFADELRQQAVGCLGQDRVITPNLDRFAAGGVVFTNAVSNRAVCSPYRAMLLTGKYPHATGVLGNCHSNSVLQGNWLKETERCLSDVLHDVGYHQGYIGKYHLDAPSEEDVPFTEGRRQDGRIWDAYTPPGPRRHGVDFWHSYGCCDQHLTPHYWEGDRKVNERIDVNDWSVKHEADVAIDYIRNQGAGRRDPGRPFSLFVSFNPPHMPFHQVPAEFVELYGARTSEELLNRPNVRFGGDGAKARRQAKNYFAAVSGVDHHFGRMLEALEQEDLAEGTIVVFTSDHGEMMGSHGLMSKTVWYEESLLVPFVIRWPASIRPGRDDLLLSVPDVMPTLLGLMGLKESVPTEVQGRDFSPLFLGRNMVRPGSALYLDVSPDNPAGGRRGLRTHRYTFVIDPGAGGSAGSLTLPQTIEDAFVADPESNDGNRLMLHDNREDPYQLKNVADQHPETVRELKDELGRWLRQTSDPWWYGDA